MFLLDFAPDQILDMALDWMYQQIVKTIGEFFAVMNNMGVELFEQPWVNQIRSLFSGIGWALFVAGIIVALFETAIEYQNGRADIKSLALNILKGLFAVNLFTVVPLELYKLSIQMQLGINSGMAGNIAVVPAGDIGDIIMGVVEAKLFGPLLAILIVVMMAYAIIKVFLASLKRGGILLIQISVGAMYMFSIPRGYMDGFVMWIKQVIATCLTSFLQSTMLACGLIMFKDQWLLGLGIILAAGEIPRIAGMFGLETSARPNINGVVNTAQSAVHLTQMITAVAK